MKKKMLEFAAPWLRAKGEVNGLIFLPSQAGITKLRIQAYALNSKKRFSLQMEIK